VFLPYFIRDQDFYLDSQKSAKQEYAFILVVKKLLEKE